MHVGLNYPWFDYGWDFGSGPPAWRGGRTSPRWLDAIDADLDRFADLGIRVVRWFILADGLSYGTGNEAPRIDPATGAWRFTPPLLEPAVLEHFDELLARFTAAAAGRLRPIQLLPVLLDFRACWPGAAIEEAGESVWVKQGREEAIADPAQQPALLDATLTPLLDISLRHPSAIYAWELMNEPDLITAGWHRTWRSLPVSATAMRAFLEEGQRRIRDAGFKSTIGFSSRSAIDRIGISADVNQFHYYARGARRLPRHAFHRDSPGIIGEFSTASVDRWPDLPDDRQSVVDRLRYARDLGYPLALPWAFRSNDSDTDWSTEVEEGIRTFTTTG